MIFVTTSQIEDITDKTSKYLDFGSIWGNNDR